MDEWNKLWFDVRFFSIIHKFINFRNVVILFSLMRMIYIDIGTTSKINWNLLHAVLRLHDISGPTAYLRLNLLIFIIPWLLFRALVLTITFKIILSTLVPTLGCQWGFTRKLFRNWRALSWNSWRFLGITDGLGWLLLFNTFRSLAATVSHGTWQWVR